MSVVNDASCSSGDEILVANRSGLRRIDRSRLLKRVFDLFLGSLILILLIPLMVAIAIAIKLDSRGPVFYRQFRHGRDGRAFLMTKFRTMFADRCDESDASIIQARPDDTRVTRIGGLLRRRNLDELPQIFDVLKGTMSLVGPRPHPVCFLEQYSTEISDYRSRLSVKPGITGWAQVHGLRGETRSIEAMRRRVDYDLHYVDNRGLGFDLKILWLTFATFDSPHAY